jgi:hypothetical protein
MARRYPEGALATMIVCLLILAAVVAVSAYQPVRFSSPAAYGSPAELTAEVQ